MTKTSSSHLQLVATAAILGEYVSAALFGAIADRRGPGAVSTTAGLLFGVGLGSLAWRYQVCAASLASGETPWVHEWVLLAAAWFVVGCGTAASYFSAMCSLSKSAPASHAGLAIALPCAVFGLSPLFLSGVASLFTTAAKAVDQGAALDVRAYLGFLGALLMAVNLAGGFLIRDLPWQENIDRVIVAAIEPFPDEENLSGYVSPGEQVSERSPLLRRTDAAAATTAVKPITTGDSFGAFISTTSFWLLGAVVFFSTGPAEMYMASVAQIIESLAPTSHAQLPSKRMSQHGTLTLSKHHVALLSISNTIWRLVIGAASDYLARPASPGRKRSGWRKHVRLVFVGGACVLLALACIWACTGMSSPSGLWVVTPGESGSRFHAARDNARTFSRQPVFLTLSPPAHSHRDRVRHHLHPRSRPRPRTMERPRLWSELGHPDLVLCRRSDALHPSLRHLARLGTAQDGARRWCLRRAEVLQADICDCGCQCCGRRRAGDRPRPPMVPTCHRRIDTDDGPLAGSNGWPLLPLASPSSILSSRVSVVLFLLSLLLSFPVCAMHLSQSVSRVRRLRSTRSDRRARGECDREMEMSVFARKEKRKLQVSDPTDPARKLDGQ